MLIAKVDDLENLLEKFTLKDAQNEAVLEEAERLRELQEKVSDRNGKGLDDHLVPIPMHDSNRCTFSPLHQLEEENHVLSEALEVVQQQADTLEAENRRLKATSSRSPPSPSPRHHRRSSGGTGSASDFPLLSSTALNVLDTTLSHMHKQLAHWRSQAVSRGVAELHPLPPLSSRRPLISTAANTQEGDRNLQSISADLIRFSSKVAAARASPAVISLSSSSCRRSARERWRAQVVEAARLRKEYEEIKEGARAALFNSSPATAASSVEIKGVNFPIPAMVKGGRDSLLGRVRIGSGSMTDAEVVPTAVHEEHIRYLASVFL